MCVRERVCVSVCRETNHVIDDDVDCCPCHVCVCVCVYVCVRVHVCVYVCVCMRVDPL